MDVRFVYAGQPVEIRALTENDHLLRDMRRRGTFYESDVLEKLRGLVSGGTAIDAGAFIGTHSIYFSKFCGMNVLAFEANPAIFPVLLHNILANKLDRVTPINRALGAAPGYASVACADAETKLGASVVTYGDRNNGVVVSTVDAELAALAVKPARVALIKIDVEGAELAVLDGAVETIRAHAPVMCIEVHTAAHLWRVLRRLRRYWIVDCLGYSPTYILVPADGVVRRTVVNLLWLTRAAIPVYRSATRWYFQKLVNALWSKRRLSA